MLPLESVADLSGVMGFDHHAAGDALRVLIPPPYAHPVHSRASCGYVYKRQISDRAIDEIPSQIVEAQTWDVDAVSSATFTSDAIREAVKMCISDRVYTAPSLVL